MRACKNCKHRVEIPYAVSVWVDLTNDHCKEYVKSTYDPINGNTITPLPCEEAMNEFCHLTSWKPTLKYRLKNLFT